MGNIIMEILTTLNKVIEFIPKIIVSIKNFAINTLHFSESTYSIVALILAVVGAFYFLKQFVTGTLWARISTLVNFLLLVLIGYLLLTHTAILGGL